MKKLVLCVVMIAISVVLVADPPAWYYNGTEDLMGEQLKTTLHNIIDDHDEYSYNNLRDFILPYTDQDIYNSNNVILLYTGWSRAIDDFGGGVSEWNREHVWAKSHGDFGNNPPCGTDAHHIRPTDVSVNSRRSNLDFDDGGNLYIDGDGNTGCYYDSNSWEPRDEVKGDVARMIFYMDVRYEGDSGEPDLEMIDAVNTDPQPHHGKMSTLLEWHFADPPDAWEMRRNDRVYEYQENRNPFIDHPEFVSRIWYGTSTGEIEVLPVDTVQLYPNPFNPNINISCNIAQSSNLKVEVFNQKGQLVEDLFEGTVPAGEWNYNWDANEQASGVYLINLTIKGQTISRKAVLLK